MKTVLVQLSIDKIDPPTSNPRFAARDLDELVESIRGVGILEPLIGVAVSDDRVRLVAGLRRFSAAKLARLGVVPIIVYPELSDRQELAMSLVENLHRKEMSPVETGAAFQRLVATGMTQLQVARMVGLSIATVSTRIAIATKLCRSARKACHEGVITAAFAFDLTKWSLVAQEGLLRARIQRRVNDAEEHRNRPAAKRRSGTGRGEAESALRSALDALHAKDRDLAIEMCEKALDVLRTPERHLQAVG